jgi:hypothetical protein
MLKSGRRKTKMREKRKGEIRDRGEKEEEEKA